MSIATPVLRGDERDRVADLIEGLQAEEVELDEADRLGRLHVVLDDGHASPARRR